LLYCNSHASRASLAAGDGPDGLDPRWVFAFIYRIFGMTDECVKKWTASSPVCGDRRAGRCATRTHYRPVLSRQRRIDRRSAPKPPAAAHTGLKRGRARFAPPDSRLGNRIGRVENDGTFDMRTAQL
jgi:hypothetical protein